MSNCHKIHKIFNKLPRHHFPFDKNLIPKNGIYILFEKGESAHGGDRIVRIGTHTGENQLYSRLLQHFLNENKDRSIFRKNIGRAILNKNNDIFLEQWEWDLTEKKSKDKYLDHLDVNKQKTIEKTVTKNIQNNFSFAVISVDQKNERLNIESKLISTVSLCPDCKPSTQWLGSQSPKEKIRTSGLWLVNELYKEPLTDKDLRELQLLIAQYSIGQYHSPIFRMK